MSSGQGAIIVPTHSKTAVPSFIETLFGKAPRDDIFCEAYTRPISLDSTLTMHGVNEFKLASLQDGFYDLSRLVLQVRVKLVDAEGAAPGVDSKLSLENNILHNLISQLSISINDVNLTGSPNLYFYKAFLHNMLRFDTEVKQSTLLVEGFAADDAGYYDTVKKNENSGFQARQELFLSSRTDGGQVYFDNREVVLMGKLITDFIFLRQQPLIPKCRVSVKINWNDNADFYLHHDSTVTKKYSLKITDCLLFVSVWSPSADLRRMLEPKLKTDPVYYHYTESVIMTESIMNVTSHSSQNLVKGGQTPAKIFIVYLKSSAFRGSKMKSPYDFRRLFEPSESAEDEDSANVYDDEDGGDVSDSDVTSNDPELREALREHLETMMGHTEESDVGDGGLLKAFYQGYQSIRDKFLSAKRAPSAGKGASAAAKSKGKGKPPAYDSIFDEPAGPSRGPNPDPTPEKPARPTPDPLGSTNYSYISKVSIVADGKQVMDLVGSNTKYDATMDFIRFLKVTGQYDNLNTTCSVSNDLFNKNCYVVSFDLSTSGRPSLAIPTVANCSMIRAETEFSAAVPYQLTQLILLHYPACFSIDSRNHVQKSYFQSSN